MRKVERPKGLRLFAELTLPTPCPASPISSPDPAGYCAGDVAGERGDRAGDLSTRFNAATGCLPVELFDPDVDLCNARECPDPRLLSRVRRTFDNGGQERFRRR